MAESRFVEVARLSKADARGRVGVTTLPGEDMWGLCLLARWARRMEIKYGAWLWFWFCPMLDGVEGLWPGVVEL